MATNENYKNNKGERMTDTQWHHVVAWGKTAELIELYLGKGKEVALEGKLVTRSWDDPQGAASFCDRGPLPYLTHALSIGLRQGRAIALAFY